MPNNNNSRDEVLNLQREAVSFFLNESHNNPWGISIDEATNAMRQVMPRGYFTTHQMPFPTQNAEPVAEENRPLLERWVVRDNPSRQDLAVIEGFVENNLRDRFGGLRLIGIVTGVPNYCNADVVCLIAEGDIGNNYYCEFIVCFNVQRRANGSIRGVRRVTDLTNPNSFFQEMEECPPALKEFKIALGRSKTKKISKEIDSREQYQLLLPVIAARNDLVKVLMPATEKQRAERRMLKIANLAEKRRQLAQADNVQTLPSTSRGTRSRLAAQRVRRDTGL